MRRVIVVILLALTILLAVYLFNSYWIHRYDALIRTQASIYRVDPDLVWSIIYEETYFSPWKIGKDGEIGLMQVTPVVGREWATETGISDFKNQMQADPQNF
ncbi:MAG TPA: transglycosylase SLT domain-containing protein, partial [Pyrinomonadaceae bacterium]|nr:transglycosylase SLT domain-containing protein [Pyrinomonadaceae bacterium]